MGDVPHSFPPGRPAFGRRAGLFFAAPVCAPGRTNKKRPPRREAAFHGTDLYSAAGAKKLMAVAPVIASAASRLIGTVSKWSVSKTPS